MKTKLWMIWANAGLIKVLPRHFFCDENIRTAKLSKNMTTKYIKEKKLLE
jgi:hypothetical protein